MQGFGSVGDVALTGCPCTPFPSLLPLRSFPFLLRPCSLQAHIGELTVRASERASQKINFWRLKRTGKGGRSAPHSCPASAVLFSVAIRFSPSPVPLTVSASSPTPPVRLHASALQA